MKEIKSKQLWQTPFSQVSFHPISSTKRRFGFLSFHKKSHKVSNFMKPGKKNTTKEAWDKKNLNNYDKPFDLKSLHLISSTTASFELSSI